MSILIPGYAHWNAVLATVLAVRRDNRQEAENLTRQAPWTATGLVRLWMESNFASYDAMYGHLEDPDETESFEDFWKGFLAQVRWETPALEPLQGAMATHCLLCNCEEWADPAHEKTLQDFFSDMIREDPEFGKTLACEGFDIAYSRFCREARGELSRYYCIGG